MLILILLFTSPIFGQDDPFPIIAKNPIFTTIFTADPSARVWEDGRLYVYPSHDLEPSGMDKYHVFSTDNMVDWTDHGQIIEASQIPWPHWGNDFMWAPDCIFRNGLYYYFFPHPSDPKDWNNSWKIGIAVSKEPAANFKILDTWLKGITYEFAMIDPNIFLDDDGTYYFYYGGGGVCMGGILTEDMLEVKDLKNMTGLLDFHEGTWVFKRNNVYYLTYPDNHDPGGNQMRYATSSNPLGPWVHQGIFLGPCESGTSHGSVVNFRGQWFLFYHNLLLSGGVGPRSVAVTKLFFDQNGGIIYQEPEKTDTTPGKRPEMLPGSREYAVKDFCLPYGGASIDGDNAVHNFHIAGTGANCTNIDGGKGGSFLFYLRYSGQGGAQVDIEINGNPAGKVLCYSNEAWDDYSAYGYTPVTLAPGNNAVNLKGGRGGVNVLSILIVPQ